LIIVRNLWNIYIIARWKNGKKFVKFVVINESRD